MNHLTDRRARVAAAIGEALEVAREVRRETHVAYPGMVWRRYAATFLGAVVLAGWVVDRAGEEVAVAGLTFGVLLGVWAVAVPYAARERYWEAKAAGLRLRVAQAECRHEDWPQAEEEVPFPDNPAVVCLIETCTGCGRRGTSICGRVAGRRCRCPEPDWQAVPVPGGRRADVCAKCGGNNVRRSERAYRERLRSETAAEYAAWRRSVGDDRFGAIDAEGRGR